MLWYNKSAKLIEYCRIGIAIFVVTIGISFSSYT